MTLTQNYINHDDEAVTLPPTAWKTWIKNWVSRGLQPTRSNVIGGLIDTMEENGVSWCDRCEVLAAHDDETADWARLVNDNASSDERSLAVRRERWRACSDSWFTVGVLPAPAEGAVFNAGGVTRVNLDAQCQVCPNFHYVSEGGQCMPCEDGKVGRGDHCEACPDGMKRAGFNDCAPCGDNEISVEGQCVPCPFGQGANKEENVCEECPADVVVDATTGCGMSQPFALNTSTAAHADICPDQFWADVKVDRQTIIRLDDEGTGQEALSESECTEYSSFLAAYRRLPEGLDFSQARVGRGEWDPNYFCVPDQGCESKCVLDGSITIAEPATEENWRFLGRVTHPREHSAFSVDPEASPQFSGV